MPTISYICHHIAWRRRVVEPNISSRARSAYLRGFQASLLSSSLGETRIFFYFFLYEIELYPCCLLLECGVAELTAAAAAATGWRRTKKKFFFILLSYRTRCFSFPVSSLFATCTSICTSPVKERAGYVKRCVVTETKGAARCLFPLGTASLLNFYPFRKSLDRTLRYVDISQGCGLGMGGKNKTR